MFPNIKTANLKKTFISNVLKNISTFAYVYHNIYWWSYSGTIRDRNYLYLLLISSCTVDYKYVGYQYDHVVLHSIVSRSVK